MRNKCCVYFVLGFLCANPGSWSRAQEPESLHFKGYPGAPLFSIAPGEKELSFYPCGDCHEFMDSDPNIRVLESPHDEIDFNHGQGRIWCLTCHEETDLDFLRTQLGEKLENSAAHQVCGGCHAQQHKDWYFGAHGKRLSNWSGERVIYGCSHCHDPHSPSIKSRKPLPPPPIRKGLDQPVSHPPETEKLWQKYYPTESDGRPGDDQE